MNAKYKSLLILITTLLVGVIIGMLISGRMVKQRLNNMRRVMEHKQHFIERLEKQTDLEAEKWNQIQPVLESHFQKMGEIRRSMRQQMGEEKIALERELKQYLTPEEMDRFFQQMWMIGRPPGSGKGRKSRPPHQLGPPDR